VDGLGDHGGADLTEAEPGVDAGDGVIGRRQEHGPDPAGERVGRKHGGERRPDAPAPVGGEHAHARDLRDASCRLVASRRERAVLAESCREHRLPRLEPLTQDRDRSGVVLRGALVALDRARLARRGPWVAERHGGHRPDQVQPGVVGSDEAHGDPVGHGRRGGGVAEDQQRMRLYLEARLGGRRGHSRRDLLDPLEGLRYKQFPLPRAYRTNVGRGNRQP
jgi:hypothetical protein